MPESLKMAHKFFTFAFALFLFGCGGGGGSGGAASNVGNVDATASQSAIAATSAIVGAII